MAEPNAELSCKDTSSRAYFQSQVEGSDAAENRATASRGDNTILGELVLQSDVLAIRSSSSHPQRCPDPADLQRCFRADGAIPG